MAAMAVLSIRSAGFHSAPHKQFINGQVEKAPYKASTIASYKAPRKASYTASKASYKASFHVGLPETIFRVTSKASATASLALASVVLALGGGRTGFPKQVSERCDSEGSWTASGRKGRFINQKRTNGQISKFGLRMADFILSRIRSSSAAKPSHLYQGLAELQLYQGRPAAVAEAPPPGLTKNPRSMRQPRRPGGGQLAAAPRQRAVAASCLTEAQALRKRPRLATSLSIVFCS